jgi:hypothetical protein
MKEQSPEEIASKVWGKLEEYKKNPNYNILTDGEILTNLIANGIITLEELNVAFDVRSKKNKSR